MNVQRIFCIGKNYADHVAELAHLGHGADGDCVVFMKPASCIVPVGQPIRLPKNQGEVHQEAELVVRLGPNAQVTHLTLGLDLTLRELQTQLKNKGAPWELAKAFDHAAPLGDWHPYRGEDLQALEFSCHVNGQPRQHGHTRDMLYPVTRQIEILARSWRLGDGDVIYTGTPKGVGPLRAGDRVTLESAITGRWEWICE
ncbi:MAG: fumarylacetoacetate hydrolase family protein [Pseudomonadota bacterium]